MRSASVRLRESTASPSTKLVVSCASIVVSRASRIASALGTGAKRKRTRARVSSEDTRGSSLSVMTTEEIPTGNSETGYSNPAYDELFAQQAVELDQEKRRDIIWEMQKIVFDDVVYIIPFYAANVQAFRNDRFQGWITDAGKVELSDITSMSVIEPVQ